MFFTSEKVFPKLSYFSYWLITDSKKIHKYIAAFSPIVERIEISQTAKTVAPNAIIRICNKVIPYTHKSVQVIGEKDETKAFKTQNKKHQHHITWNRNKQTFTCLCQDCHNSSKPKLYSPAEIRKAILTQSWSPQNTKIKFS